MTTRNDTYLPDDIKDLIGQLSIATAKSTDPANKISLTSSRISYVLGAMKVKCREKVPPGMYETLYTTLQKMISDMLFEESDSAIIEHLKQLENIVNENTKENAQYITIVAMECLSDYNAVLACRERWKIANDVYMKDHEAWSMSNKMLADIHDVLTDIEIRNRLITVPKNISWDINDLNFSKPRNDLGGE